MFWLQECGTYADRCTLSVVLHSAVPTLVGANHRCSWCERVEMLFIWSGVWVGNVPCCYLGLVCSETIRCIGVLWKANQIRSW